MRLPAIRIPPPEGYRSPPTTVQRPQEPPVRRDGMLTGPSPAPSVQEAPKKKFPWLLVLAAGGIAAFFWLRRKK